MFYKVPYRLHKKGAKTKAGIGYFADYQGELVRVVGFTGDTPWVDFTAKSHAEAGRKLQELILPGDPRPIMGRTLVRHFAVTVPNRGVGPKPG